MDALVRLEYIVSKLEIPGLFSLSYFTWPSESVTALLIFLQQYEARLIKR